MRGKLGFILFTVGVITFAGCEPAEEVDPPPTPTTQPTEAAEPDPRAHPHTSPIQAADAFLQALENGDVEAAAKLVADESPYLDAAKPTPRVDPQALDRELRQAAQAIPSSNAFEVLDSHVIGDYAIVATRFAYAEEPGGAPQVRPVVLVAQDTQWRIIWDLFGMEPDEMRSAPAVAERLEPLYDWYRTRADELTLDIVATPQDTP